jgi:hypothetical protein
MFFHLKKGRELMTRLNRAILPDAPRVTRSFPKSAIVLSILIASLSCARADDLTGLPVDDPKDLLPAPPAPVQPTAPTGSLFAPMPGWARGITLGPLPDKLQPMGRSTTASPAPQTPSLTPPKDTTSPTTTTTTAAAPKPASSDPDMVTVSPFLQWIKANPQAAAAAARQQAESYHAGPPPENGPGGANAAARNNPQDDAYWMPPLIDSADFGSSAVTGSAAIYSRPQR